MGGRGGFSFFVEYVRAMILLAFTVTGLLLIVLGARTNNRRFARWCWWVSVGLFFLALLIAWRFGLH